jgi:hypothetical protein
MRLQATSGEIDRLLTSHAALQDAHQAAKNELQYSLDRYLAPCAV